ncbi:DsbA family protein [Acetilactobacillus jinshanensis]|uniref:DsbA family protein n=1 Tax=Acetilactobacillus jinshanensis TaxID=1720083 RepID=A0A4P6ZK53_9LACO|nr:DsbA family protein [Acetilactobacillus jinshanensis]QBP17887.1 hypothetical protein ELX58_01695 [Acetilactobacillus jinshanensis]URL60749.1 hypothetical protein HGK75_01725 [uncultured bacterium]
MLEAYLFVDPLCKQCIKSEKIIKRLAKNLNTHFLYQFIPMLNIKILNNTRVPKMARIHQQLYYQIVMDYKAALFHGKKRGQNFFITLQEELLNDKDRYNNRLVLATAENSKLDLDMFKEDRRSQLAKKSFEADQQLVHEMKITKPSSAVIFNWAMFNYGILFNNVNYDDLYRVCHSQPERINRKSIRDNHGIPVPHVSIN